MKFITLHKISQFSKKLAELTIAKNGLICSGTDTENLNILFHIPSGAVRWSTKGHNRISYSWLWDQKLLVKDMKIIPKQWLMLLIYKFICDLILHVCIWIRFHVYLHFPLFPFQITHCQEPCMALQYPLLNSDIHIQILCVGDVYISIKEEISLKKQQQEQI